MMRFLFVWVNAVSQENIWDSAGPYQGGGGRGGGRHGVSL